MNESGASGFLLWLCTTKNCFLDAVERKYVASVSFLPNLFEFFSTFFHLLSLGSFQLLCFYLFTPLLSLNYICLCSPSSISSIFLSLSFVHIQEWAEERCIFLLASCKDTGLAQKQSFALSSSSDIWGCHQQQQKFLYTCIQTGYEPPPNTAVLVLSVCCFCMCVWEYVTWRFVLMYSNLKPQIQGSLSLLEGRLREDVRMPEKQASTELD